MMLRKVIQWLVGIIRHLELKEKNLILLQAIYQILNVILVQVIINGSNY